MSDIRETENLDIQVLESLTVRKLEKVANLLTFAI